MKVFRVQDREGRGPFRPGFTATWLDDDRNFNLPSVIQEFPKVIRLIQQRPGHYGCGCRDVEQLGRWFTAGELVRLQILGYRVVSMDADEVLAESANQLVFRRSRPLNEDIEQLEAGRMESC